MYFAEAVKEAGEWDFVYFDPPYHPMSDTACFSEYTAAGFGKNEQRRFADLFGELHERGCFVLESNSAATLFYEIYSDRDYVLDKVHAKRAISCNPEASWQNS